MGSLAWLVFVLVLSQLQALSLPHLMPKPEQGTQKG